MSRILGRAARLLHTFHRGLASEVALYADEAVCVPFHQSK